MKKNGIVKSCQNKSIIVDTDNVYINSNIKEINDNGITMYEFEQTQYTLNEFLEFMFMEHELLKRKIEGVENEN